MPQPKLQFFESLRWSRPLAPGGHLFRAVPLAAGRCRWLVLPPGEVAVAGMWRSRRERALPAGHSC